MKRILRLPQVIDRTGRSKSWIYDAMKTGDFPPQVKLSKQAVGWLEADIDQWITKRIEETKVKSAA
ncbi:MAG: helix-turn-helix transcriptional regulator [Candidatus Thiodiazotropha endolucinida]